MERLNMKKLLAIAKPRSKESLEKEKYWLEHKEEIKKLQEKELNKLLIKRLNKKVMINEEKKLEFSCLTNLAKAQEIGELYSIEYNNCDCETSYDECCNSAIAMAEWKDEQYAERIKQLEQALIDANCRCEELQMQLEELKTK